MHPARILVVAPEGDLRQSLRFALEAEHFEVTWRASIGAKQMPSDYDCTVLDHNALGEDIAAARVFAFAFDPVILLANQPHELSASVFRTVLKPHLGAPLIDAVRDALTRPQLH
jgi:DNA-binding response OmpR family regulator